MSPAPASPSQPVHGRDRRPGLILRRPLSASAWPAPASSRPREPEELVEPEAATGRRGSQAGERGEGGGTGLAPRGLARALRPRHSQPGSASFAGFRSRASTGLPLRPQAGEARAASTASSLLAALPGGRGGRAAPPCRRGSSRPGGPERSAPARRDRRRRACRERRWRAAVRARGRSPQGGAPAHRLRLQHGGHEVERADARRTRHLPALVLVERRKRAGSSVAADDPPSSTSKRAGRTAAGAAGSCAA